MNQPNTFPKISWNEEITTDGSDNRAKNLLENALLNCQDIHTVFCTLFLGYRSKSLKSARPKTSHQKPGFPQS